MFKNKTAWFSRSCAMEISDLWVQHEGKLEEQDLAQFIFSESWDSEDTKCLLESEAYLSQHLAVFSPHYVTDVVRLGKESVCLGKFFLVPKVIKDRISRLEDHQSYPISDHISANTSKAHAPPQQAPLTPKKVETNFNRSSSSQADQSTNSTFTRANDIPDVKSFPKFVGQLRTVVPGASCHPYYIVKT